MHYVGKSTYQFIPYYDSAIHKHTHTRILKPSENSEPTGLKVDIAVGACSFKHLTRQTLNRFLPCNYPAVPVSARAVPSMDGLPPVLWVNVNTASTSNRWYTQCSGACRHSDQAHYHQPENEGRKEPKRRC